MIVDSDINPKYSHNCAFIQLVLNSLFFWVKYLKTNCLFSLGSLKSERNVMVRYPVIKNFYWFSFLFYENC